ncbi:MAG TPA: transaldolase family protein, partial [Rubrobacter sp.]|nr:transaldolase family protein [Rubrobacter sp.]
MPVYEQTEHKDGYVSLEVSPELAFDTEGTITRAKLLWEMVDRPNLLVKIPATKQSLGAIEDSIAACISINVTLIFSLERYRAVAEAYIRGLERLGEGGGDPSKVASVASFFVSRVDTETDRRLEEVGREDLKGRLAIDNAKIAYQEFKKSFGSPKWESLASSGAKKQRLLWASTSTKSPEYKDGYVSLEVSPELAFDTEGTITRAKLLWEMVDRPNLLVKIPATKESLGAIEDSIAAGISVNVTLIFSLERYRAVAEAYIRGLERLVEGGGDPSKVASVASFFVSRVDTETDRRLEEVGCEDLKGRLAIDNAKIVYQEFKKSFGGPKWESLESRGAKKQRPLWASTST